MLKFKCELINETATHRTYREGWYLFGIIPWIVCNRKFAKIIR